MSWTPKFWPVKSKSSPQRNGLYNHILKETKIVSKQSCTYIEALILLHLSHVKISLIHG